MSFSLPKILTKDELIKKVLKIEDTGKRTRLIEDNRNVIKTMEENIDIYSGATELSAVYRINPDIVLDALREIYPEQRIIIENISVVSFNEKIYKNHSY